MTCVKVSGRFAAVRRSVTYRNAISVSASEKFLGKHVADKKWQRERVWFHEIYSAVEADHFSVPCRCAGIKHSKHCDASPILTGLDGCIAQDSTRSSRMAILSRYMYEYMDPMYPWTCAFPKKYRETRGSSRETRGLEYIKCAQRCKTKNLTLTALTKSFWDEASLEINYIRHAKRYHECNCGFSMRDIFC